MMDIKKFLHGFGRGIFMLLLFGGILIFQTAKEVVVSFKPAISFEDLLEDGVQVKAGSHVAGNVVFSLDYFASESTYTQYSNGSRSGDRKSGNYYLIPTADAYIGLKSREADVSALNKLSDETFDFLDTGIMPTTEIFMEGAVEAMEDDVAKYYREYLEDMGYSQAEIDAMGEPLVIQYVAFGPTRVLFLIGVALIVIAIIILCRRYKKELEGSGLNRVEDLPNTVEN